MFKILNKNYIISLMILLGASYRVNSEEKLKMYENQILKY